MIGRVDQIYSWEQSAKLNKGTKKNVYLWTVAVGYRESLVVMGTTSDWVAGLYSNWQIYGWLKVHGEDKLSAHYYINLMIYWEA